MATLVLTVIGEDRSGLVAALAGVVTEHGGNWHTSHMSELAGKFAGIVMVTVPDQNTDGFIAALEPLEEQGLLDTTVMVQTGSEGPPEPTRHLTLELLGDDRPGIVHDISQALAALDVSISELRTETRDAPMAGGVLFDAHALLDVPETVTVEHVRDALETIAHELLVNLYTAS